MTQHGDASDVLRGMIKRTNEMTMLPEVLKNMIEEEKKKGA